MNSVTVDQVMSFRPCDPPYTRDYVTELFAGRETVTALDILDSGIPPEDKLWAVLRPELVPEPDLHELACRFTEDWLEAEVKAGRRTDKRSWEAVKAKRRWLKGEITDEELDVAYRAAYAAANNTYATRAAAVSATHAAAYIARADRAAYAAAVSGARERQVSIIRGYLRRET